jgi:hypothetical protein
VAGEQVDRVADRFGGRREGRAHRSKGFHSGANRAAGSDGAGAEEQLRAPALGRGAAVSLGRCRGGEGGLGVWSERPVHAEALGG